MLLEFRDCLGHVVMRTAGLWKLTVDCVHNWSVAVKLLISRVWVWSTKIFGISPPRYVPFHNSFGITRLGFHSRELHKVVPIHTVPAEFIPICPHRGYSLFSPVPTKICPHTYPSPQIILSIIAGICITGNSWISKPVNYFRLLWQLHSKQVAGGFSFLPDAGPAAAAMRRNAPSFPHFVHIPRSPATCFHPRGILAASAASPSSPSSGSVVHAKA